MEKLYKSCKKTEPDDLKNLYGENNLKAGMGVGSEVRGGGNEGMTFWERGVKFVCFR